MIHIFLGEESNNNDNDNNNDNSKKKIKNKNQYMENSLLADSSSSGQNLLDIIDKDISESNDNIIIMNEDSLFEKEYYYMKGNNIKTFKLYFTNLFRDNHKLIQIRTNDNYCKFMQNKIFKYLSKNSLFNEENKNEKSNDSKDDE